MGFRKRLGHFTLALGALGVIASVGAAQPPTTNHKSGSTWHQSKSGSSTTQPKSGSTTTPSHSSKQQQQQQQQSNQELKQALQELQTVERTLAGADHDYGGHRVDAMREIHSAEQQIREGLQQHHSGSKSSNHAGSTAGNHSGAATSSHSTAHATGKPAPSTRGPTTAKTITHSGNASKSHPEPQNASNQQLSNAIPALNQAITALKQAKHDYGGHRELAVKDLEKAIYQIEKAEHYAKEHDRHKK